MIKIKKDFEKNLQKPIAIKGKPEEKMQLEERMLHYRIPGISIAVMDKGEIAWTAQYGSKSVDVQDPVTEQTIFQAASISKAVSAMGFMKLVENGLIDLDTNVNEYLQDWQLPDNEFTEKEKVTFRRLLSHSAGLSVHGFGGYPAGSEIPSVTQILDGEKPANSPAVRVDTEPGSIWRYSGGGTILAQYLAINVAGKPFDSYMQETVFNPLKMSFSTMKQPLPSVQHPFAATAHDPMGKPYPGGWHVYPELAAAGLWTTPSDLCRYALDLRASALGQNGKVLSTETAKEMLTIQKGDYGLGPSIIGEGEGKYFSHGGSNAGFRCHFVCFLESGQGVAIMTNSDNGSFIFPEIMASLADLYDWPAFKPIEKEEATLTDAELQAYSGIFFLPAFDNAEFSITWDNGLWIQVPYLTFGKVQLHALSEEKFFIKEHKAMIKFINDGEQLKGLIEFPGQDFPFERKQ